MASMTSRERFHAVLNHQEPDRVPADLGGIVCSVSTYGYNALLARLGMEHLPNVKFCPMQQLAVTNEEVLQRFQIDFRHIYPNNPEGWEDITISGNPDADLDAYMSGAQAHTYIDEWGITWRRAAYYYDMVERPLTNAESVAEIERYPWPDGTDRGRLRGLREQAKYWRENTDYVVVLNPPAGGLLDMAFWTRGFEGMMADLAYRSPRVEALLDQILRFTVDFFCTALEHCGEYIDVVVVGDDYGCQRGMLISPEQWRWAVKPRLAELIAAMKKKAPVKYFHHTCGSVTPIIEEMAAIGVDILNPIQPQAAHMQAANLKKHWGDIITFHGGIDEQALLPKGTPAEVARTVQEQMSILARGGGYIVAPAHNIQADVPAANIMALYDTVLSRGTYPLPALS